MLSIMYLEGLITIAWVQTDNLFTNTARIWASGLDLRRSVAPPRPKRYLRLRIPLRDLHLSQVVMEQQLTT